MIPPKAITFDCAGTLVELRRSVPEALLEAASELRLPVRAEHAQIFYALYTARLPQFHDANLAGPDAVRAFWSRLSGDWLSRCGHPVELAEDLRKRVDELACGPGQIMFRVFPDVLPCLERLRARGIPMAVISNWDSSLHRVLDTLGLAPFFQCSVASLEHGWEKPDPRLFHLALERLGVAARDAAHVGDHPVDDKEGAEGVDMRAVLLDRTGVMPNAIASLDQLEEVLGWTA